MTNVRSQTKEGNTFYHVLLSYLSCGNMGRQDVVKHSHGKMHQRMAKSMEKQATIAQSTSLQSQQGMKTTEAELKMAVLATSSNIPLPFHDQLSLAIRTYFHDSKTAGAYHSASTKSTCMNEAVAPSFIKKQMKRQPFSISSDDNELCCRHYTIYALIIIHSFFWDHVT